MKSLICALSFCLLLLQGCGDYHYGHGGWHHGGWHHDEIMRAADQVEDGPSLLAANYGISALSAQTITDFAAGANSQQILNQWGISSSDLAPLASQQMPSEETVQKIATSLAEDPAKIDRILSGFIVDEKNGQ